MLQKEVEHTPSAQTDAAAAFLASLEEPKLTSLGEAGKKPLIEILPPGMASLSVSTSLQKKPAPANHSSQLQPGKQMLLEAPPAIEAPPATSPVSTPLQSESTPAPVSVPLQSESDSTSVSAARESELSLLSPMSASLQSESSEPVSNNRAPGSLSLSNPDSVALGATSTTNSTLAEALPQIPVIQETSSPIT